MIKNWKKDKINYASDHEKKFINKNRNIPNLFLMNYKKENNISKNNFHYLNINIKILNCN